MYVSIIESWLPPFAWLTRVAKFRPQFLEKRKAGLSYFLQYVHASGISRPQLIVSSKLYITKSRIFRLPNSQGVFILVIEKHVSQVASGIIDNVSIK